MDGEIDRMIQEQIESKVRELFSTILGEKLAIYVKTENDHVLSIHHTKFARKLGVSSDVVRGWLDNPRIPQVRKLRIGKRSFVDVQYFIEKRAELANFPNSHK